jgi:hypothetical protein
MNNPQKAELLEDIAKYKDLKILAASEGGKLLISALRTDIISAVESLSQYRDLEYKDFVTISSKLHVLLNVYKSLTQAQSNEKVLLDILEEQYK